MGLNQLIPYIIKLLEVYCFREFIKYDFYLHNNGFISCGYIFPERLKHF